MGRVSSSKVRMVSGAAGCDFRVPGLVAPFHGLPSLVVCVLMMARNVAPLRAPIEPAVAAAALRCLDHPAHHLRPRAPLPRTSRRALLRRQVLRQRVQLVADRRSELRIHISHARPCAVASASRSAEPRPRYTVQGAFGALAVADQIPIMTTPTLTPCVACQHLVSTQSNKCPACGQPSHA